MSRALWRVWFVVFPWLPLVGCSHFRIPTIAAAPAASIHTPGGASVTQSGDAQTPAGFSSDETVVTITPTAVPAPAGVTESKTAPTVAPVPVVTITTRHESATAPRAFTPPPPPTPPTAAELAHASVTKWFWIAALLLLLWAGVLAYAQHYLAALKIAAGAIALPILARLFGSPVAITVTVGLVAAGAALWLAWRILASRYKLEAQSTK